MMAWLLHSICAMMPSRDRFSEVEKCFGESEGGIAPHTSCLSAVVLATVIGRCVVDCAYPCLGCPLGDGVPTV